MTGSDWPGALRRHLLIELLPLWFEHGLDRTYGGFWPKLRVEDLRPGPDRFKRLVATTRQIYAYSHAALLGAPEWALETARHGIAFLERFRDPRHGGWYLTTTLEGKPLDRRKDTYAHAFVLYAMAYYHQATGDPQALVEAERTLDLLEQNLADPIHGGFLEGASESWEPVSEARRSNPHMHLFEAFLALDQATRDPRYLEHAHAIARLFRSHFLDAERGFLGEYFARGWSRDPGALGSVLEPGHHFEWVWLLHQYVKQGADESWIADADRLFRFAERFGVDTDGGVFDEIDPEGRVTRATKRLWPQTEYLKARVARYERSRDTDELEGLERGLRFCFDHLVHPRHRGWIDHLERNRSLHSDLMPATSLYHVTLALAEIIRVLG